MDLAKSYNSQAGKGSEQEKITSPTEYCGCEPVGNIRLAENCLPLHIKWLPDRG